jgi:hypothetical protein
LFDFGWFWLILVLVVKRNPSAPSVGALFAWKVFFSRGREIHVAEIHVFFLNFGRNLRGREMAFL